MKKFVKCPHCGNCQFVEIDTAITKFEGEENELLQNECLKLQKRIDKLQYKHDYEDLSNWKLNDVNNKLLVFTKIKDILEEYI